MTRFIAAVALGALVLLVACAPVDVPLTDTSAPQVVRVFTSIPTAIATTEVNQPLDEPGIPTVVETLNFGVSSGNGNWPQQVAVDGQHRRLYTFNEGLTAAREGNSISIIDLDTGEVSALLRLDNMPQDAAFPPTPLDLQVDPYRARLYALWGDAFADTASITLTIIDTDTLDIIDSRSGIGAIAPGPEQLYLANETRLWTVDPGTWRELSSQKLELRQFNRPLRLDPETNRLYLGRGQPWTVELFAADTLTSLGSYAAGIELIEVVVDPTRKRVLVIYNENGQTILQALDSAGLPLPGLDPLILADEIVFSKLPLVATEQSLYWVAQDRESYAYSLHRARLQDLTPQDSLPLAHLPNDLAADLDKEQLYTAYSSPDSFVLTIEPTGGDTEILYTAIDIIDALTDPDRDRLYVLTNQGDLQILSLTGYEEIDRVQTGFNTAGTPYKYGGQLSPDPDRQRLYLSGDPIRVVDTNTLEVTPYPDLRGQLTPDPSGDRLYLTPPCRCQQEQCNTLILNSETLTGTDTLFPLTELLSAPCVIRTQLDDRNQLLYATIYNGVPGSNSGDYFTVFDTQPNPPEQIYSDWQISYGQFALDPPLARAFVPRYRMDRSFIHRLDAQGQTITQTLVLAGAQGQLIYDPVYARLYAVNDTSLQVFDGDLALLTETTLPGEGGSFEPLTFDPQGQRLYLRGSNAQMLVMSGGGGQLEPAPPIAVQPDQVYPQKLLVASDGTRFRLDNWRLYRSRDEGQSWQALGRGLPGHPTSDVALSPNYEQDQTVLAGLWNFGRGGGLYRSTDGGDTWRPTTRGLTDLEIQQIVFSPTYAEDRTIFVSTRHRGLFRSSDGGDTWTPLGDNYATESPDQSVSHLAVSPTFSGDGLVFVGHNRLLRSADGGDTWSDTSLPPGLMAFSPDFAKDGLVLSEGRWRSTDRGQSWQPAAAGLEPARQAQAILFSPNFSDDKTVYILLQPDFQPNATLQRSVDGGRTWESLVGRLAVGFDLQSASILPSGKLQLVAYDGQIQSTAPETLAWGRPPIDLAQLDLQSLAIAPGGEIFVANSAAGVLKSEDGGQSWQDTDFPARASDLQTARLAMAENGTLFAAVGTALERSSDGGQSWTYLANLPPGFSVTALGVSPKYGSDGVVLIGGNYSQNQLLRSADGGYTWEIVFDGSTLEGSSDLSLIAFSPNFDSDGLVYAWLQEGGLLRSRDGGLSWKLLNGEQGQYFGQVLAIDPEGERLYLGALDGRLLRSTNQGESWTDLGGNIPGDRVWSSALAFASDGRLYLGTDVGIFRSPDGGQSWTESNKGLALDPNQNRPQSIRGLAFSDERLYAALTQGGLYVTANGGETWQRAEK